MSFPLALSTVQFLAGLLLVCWIHTRHCLDIIVRPVTPAPDVPLISVCVPACNEAHTIAACVEAISAETYPKIELIVVDERSIDSTAATLSSFEHVSPDLPS